MEKQKDPACIFETMEELDEEVTATVTGNIPSWLKGTLLRNGPGKFEFGDSKYNHWFDGQALLHRFAIEQGKVKYYNKFVRGETFTINTLKNQILFTEFGTNGHPDPCKNIFQRFFSYFGLGEEPMVTDNCLVNVVEVKGKKYAVSEPPHMMEIHPNTLEVLSKVNITKEFPSGDVRLDSSLAHPHNEKDGTTYNLGTTQGSSPKYHVTVIPPKAVADEQPLEGGKILCSVPSHSTQAYFHSFGMTENYLILMENPLLMSVPKILTHKLFGWSIADCFYWYPTQLSHFHIISKETGKQLGIFTAEPTFTFHHVNAFETDSEIVVDLCGYDDANIIQLLYLHELRGKEGSGPKKTSIPSVRRYQIPLPLPNNLEPVQLPKNAEGQDFEVLGQAMELPRINYDLCNGKPYEYIYGLHCTKKAGFHDALIKLNVKTKEEIKWKDHGENLLSYPSEPVFVPRPGSTDEDDGVILSVVIDVSNQQTFLLVLDGKTFKEVGRAEVPFITTATIHGAFVKN
ncbi:beta,beta-carotene 9',10'-oxygenase-like [Actinia tenebrosa]|uniref:Beta,beta-carotene 9',10'-oxygenase-like n=1 Tax=Actinia tenebrosa TaxID=6105 RepID=A0A6P8HRU3_ACTTE|nr:beta,beta-carotene 9',10'-oxygenase-like [Actinia tenebrosa]